jgi:hypothetical protein
LTSKTAPPLVLGLEGGKRIELDSLDGAGVLREVADELRLGLRTA